MDVTHAQCLRLLRHDKLTPLLLQVRHTGEMTWTTGDLGDNLNLRLTCVDTSKDVTIWLPFFKHRFVWNPVSSSSFQMLVVGLNKMKRTFTGTELSKILASVPVDPSQVQVDFNLQFASWKRLQAGRHSQFILDDHDTSGRPLKNVTLSLILKFQKSTLFWICARLSVEEKKNTINTDGSLPVC